MCSWLQLHEYLLLLFSSNSVIWDGWDEGSEDLLWLFFILQVVDTLHDLQACVWAGIRTLFSSVWQDVPYRITWLRNFKILTTCLILYRSSFCCQTALTRHLKVWCDIWYGSRTFMSFRFWGGASVDLTCLFQHPTDACLDWDLGNLVTKSTPWTCRVPHAVLEPLLPSSR